jgi:hypothetical protein
MLLATLLAALLPIPTRDADPPSDPVLVLRVHSLAGLVENHGREDAALRLLPYAASNHDVAQAQEVSGGPGPCVLTAEDVCSLVRENISPAFWEETPGASIDLRGPSRMFVVATPEIQDAIADFLARLVTALAPTEVLEVRVLQGVPTEGNEVALDGVEADRRVAAADVLRRASAALRGRAVVAADDVERESIVYDWEVEIAQGASIADPVSQSVAVGLEFIARSSRVEGGTLLNLVARASDRAAPTTPRRTRATSLVNAKSAMSERTAAGVFEHPEIYFSAFAGTVFVPEGKAVQVPVVVVTHLGEMRLCLDLRVTGRLSPLRATYDPKEPRQGEPMRLDLLNCGAAEFGRVDTDRLRPGVFDDGWAQDNVTTDWGRITQPDQGSYLVELVRTIASEALESGQGTVSQAGGCVLTCLPRPFADKVASALAPMQKFDGQLLVKGRVVQDGEERATFRLPVVLGQPVALWAGVQGTRILDWDVDVANEAQTCNPEPEAWVDGFALRLEVARSAAGDLVLDASGKVCLLEGPPQPLELQDDSRLTIDKIRSRTLFVDELRALPAQGGKATFGGSLALELEVIPSGR